MASFNLLSVVFGLVTVAHLCEATLEDFCTDVSFWDVIKYTSETAKCCDTVLKEECKTKNKRVCEDATEIKCNTVGWAECTTKIWPSQGKKCHVTYKDFPYKDCKEEKYSVQHYKEVPECKTVTKDNCVTDWNIDEHGNKVWGGKEKCEPVSWEECKIVKKAVDFPAVKTNCETVATIKWADFVQGTTELVEMKQTCKVKSSVNCRPVTVNNCVDVRFTECELKAHDSCYSQTVYEPEQEKIHQKKCLVDTAERKYSRNKRSDGEDETETEHFETQIEMVPECKDVTKQSCVDIWETDHHGNERFVENKCTPVTWEECKLVEKEVQFPTKHCQETEHFETQIKMVPECKDVIKQSCLDIWETDHHGNKRVVDNKCTPMTWEECKLVEKEVQFPTFQTNCKT